MTEPMLKVRGLSKSFGGLKAVHQFDLDVFPNEIVGLIGPNGAGKSTAFNVICGALRPTAGSVLFGGRDIAGLPSAKIVRYGLARTFQSAAVYAKVTVAENLFRAGISQLGVSLGAQFGRTSTFKNALRRLEREADTLLELTGLAAHRQTLAGNLPYGLQKRLGVAISLATKPQLLLLDEPAAGLNPEECDSFGLLLGTLRRDLNLSLLLVEHHMMLVMKHCERIVVLVQGEKLAEGTPAEIRNNRSVVEAYLGVPEHAID